METYKLTDTKNLNLGERFSAEVNTSNNSVFMSYNSDSHGEFLTRKEKAQVVKEIISEVERVIGSKIEVVKKRFSSHKESGEGDFQMLFTEVENKKQTNSQERLSTKVEVVEMVHIQETTKEAIESFHPTFANSTLYVLMMTETFGEENNYTLKSKWIITNEKAYVEVPAMMVPFLQFKGKKVDNPSEKILDIIDKSLF